MAARILTRQQLAVLVGVANGESIKETAARLWLSCGTVRCHRAGAYRRLGARNGAGHAVALAMAAGLIRPEQVRGVRP